MPVALGMFTMGAATLMRPGLIPAMFGSAQPTSEGRTEIRAVYGGFGIAVAVALAWAANTSTNTARGVLLAFGIGIAGMAIGRLIGIVIERSASFHPTVTYLLIEIVAAAALVTASR
jgi:hypothetical protein